MTTEVGTELLDLALVCMGLADVDSVFPEMEELHVSRAMFDGASIAHPEMGSLVANGRQDIFYDARCADLTKPLDVKLLTTAVRADGSAKPFRDEFALQRYRRVSPKEVRGIAQFLTPNMVEWVAAFVMPGEGKIETTRSYWGEVSPFHWRRLDGFPWGDHAWNEASGFAGFNRAEANLNIAHGIAFTERYEWEVYLGTPKFPGLSIPTSPAGALEMFKLREAPEGQRRAALRHWVGQHIRHIASEERDAEEVLVREHLRGATAFHWEGLTCKIIPSDFDQERNERSKREASQRRRKS